MARGGGPLERIDYRLNWNKYCGFLDLDMAEFYAIQEALLGEQLAIIGGSLVAGQFLAGKHVASSAELRREVQLTSYKDYEPLLQQRDEAVLAEKLLFWSRTSTGADGIKWVPFTRRAYVNLAHNVLATFVLACADKKGEVNVTTADRFLYTVAPSPFLTGFLARAIEGMGFRLSLSVKEHDELGFHAAVRAGVDNALRQGCDLMLSLASVATSVAQRISSMSSGRRSGSVSRMLRDPRVLLRIAKARLISRMEGRPVLPRDLWKLKGLVGWGIDMSLLRNRIKRDWGVEPFEFMACTEAGILAMQSWSKRAMTFVPGAVYLEFLPEREVAHLRRDPDHSPTTVLLHELQVGQRYEVVITSFYGMPFLRYRTGLMVRVVAPENKEEGIHLPQVELVGRSDGLIDIAGFTRMDERTLWEALIAVGIEHGKWSARREGREGQAVLALYIEVPDGANLEEMKERIHQGLREKDRDYRDVEELLGMRPLEIKPLAPGTFEAYRQLAPGTGVERELAGQVPKTSAPQEVIDTLVKLNQR